MSRTVAWLSLVVATAGIVTLVPRDAAACGGCFAPQENPTVVTDHRMVLTIAKDQSTLYDQIRYTGSPASFAWVLPISGEVQVGVSSEHVFQLLDVMTQTQIIAPPQNCPPPPVCPNQGGFGGADAGASPTGGGVEVTKRETVGPYDTVQLKASDPAALQTWLAQNGYPVPADVQPVIDQYVAEKFDFLALKLLPGKQVQDMRPVRVTTAGANVVLPLRMIAAGSGANVGISLWTLGEGRYEPQNFPTFAIKAEELVWDWVARASNYKDLRAQKTTAGGGKAWEIESSTDTQRTSFEDAMKNGYFDRTGMSGGYIPGDRDAAAYLPVKDAQGNVTKTALQVRAEDLEALFHGVVQPRVTRTRADLAKAALATDLAMGASADQSILATTRQITREANQPMCPVYSGCDQVGSAPRDEAAAQTAANNDSLAGGCATIVAKAKDSSPAWLAVGGGFLALALVKAARRRRQS